MKQEQENLLTLLETIILMQMLIENLEMLQGYLSGFRKNKTNLIFV